VKKYLLLLPLLLLPACASTPPTVHGAEKVEKMERRDVIRAVTECDDADMKPYVEYVTQTTVHGKILVPINVHCDPVRKK
jgi:starvation-inducible outer membrane lipoprotein